MAMSTFSDDKIVLDEISKGNIEAYRYLFDNYFSDLCNFLLLYLHDRSLSEEIALDIFAYLWEKRDHIKIKTSIKGFLFAAAKNRSVSHYREEQKKLLAKFNLDEITLADPDCSQEILENKELQQIIDQAIEKLPPQSRLIYKMAWEENLSQKEIAKKLQLSTKTVENHVGIALRKLREMLRPYYDQIFICWLISKIF